MDTIKASEFKAKCLQLMDQVARTGVELTITKNGIPVAKLVPTAALRPVVVGSVTGANGTPRPARSRAAG
jgi:prevent-host-death family protein